jgi:exodeoxyribonuclease V gamma subunit
LLALKETIFSQLQPWFEKATLEWPVQSLCLQAHGLTVTLPYGGDHTRWRQRADGSGLYTDMRAGHVLHGNALYAVWLGHLAANAAGISTESVQSGVDGVVVLKPLPPSQALAWLETLVLLYQQAWFNPLPVARKTACTYVLQRQKETHSDLPEEAQRRKALSAARTTLEGNRFRHGELTDSPYLQRVFSRFEDMDMQQFDALAMQIYGPMLNTSNLSVSAEVEDEA